MTSPSLTEWIDTLEQLAQAHGWRIEHGRNWDGQAPTYSDQNRVSAYRGAEQIYMTQTGVFYRPDRSREDWVASRFVDVDYLIIVATILQYLGGNHD